METNLIEQSNNEDTRFTEEQNKNEHSSNVRKRAVDDTEQNTELILMKIKNGLNNDVKDIHLHKDEIIIGRGRDADVLILSTYISRSHCRLKRIQENEWTVTNLSSTTTLLNDKPITRGDSLNINLGDILQLSESSDYKYLVTLSVKCSHTAKRICLQETKNEFEMKEIQFGKNQDNEKKNLEKKLEIGKKNQVVLMDQLDKLLKEQQNNKKDDEKLKEKILALEKKIEDGNKTENELKLKYEQLVAKLEEEKKNFEEKIAVEKKKWEEALEITKKEKESLETDIKVKEAEWRSKIDNAEKEKNSVQEQYTNKNQELEEKVKQMEEVIKEKDQQINEASKKNVEGTIDCGNNFTNFKVENIGDLQILDIIDLTSDIVEVVETTPPSTSTDSTIDVVNNIMEEEFTCSICSELFIDANSLNCTHTFCKYCILTWMNKSKDCPNCRTVIYSMNKSLVLDNFIDKMVEKFSPEQKQKRKELIRERKRILKRKYMTH